MPNPLHFAGLLLALRRLSVRIVAALARRILRWAYRNWWRLLAALGWASLMVRLWWPHHLVRDAVVAAASLIAILLTLGVAYMRHGAAEWTDALADIPTWPPYEEDPDDSEETRQARDTIENAWLSSEAKGRLLVVATPFIVSVCVTLASVLFDRTPLPIADSQAHFRDTVAAGVRVAIALSGGGYRAAAMHAGVLDELREQHIAITHVTSVSGGSIIGAYFVAGGRPHAFVDAVAQGRFNLRAELADLQNVVRLRLMDLGATAPRFMLCATDLVTGDGVGLSADGVLYLPVGTQGQLAKTRSTKPLLIPVDSAGVPAITSVATLVAASGAFPAAFPVVPLQHQGRQLRLADGGIFDNSGIRLLTTRARIENVADRQDATWGVDLVIASDAGRPFRETPKEGFVSDLGRVIDIISTNSEAAIDMAIAEGVPVIRLAPDDLLGAVGTGKAWPPSILRERAANADIIKREVADSLAAFYSTDTIEDSLGPSAERLYQLGRYLVWSQVDVIRRAVAAADTRRSQ